MKIIQDTAQVDELMRESHIRERFDTPDLAFRAQQYQKGELLCSPLCSTENILFLLKGSVQMYDLREDGSKIPVASVSEGAIIGEMEFITGRPTVYFVEAAEECLCIALPIVPNCEALSTDVRFLNSLLGSLADKFESSANIDIGSSALEEKLLQYLHKDTEDHEIHEVERLCHIAILQVEGFPNILNHFVYSISSF